MIRLVPNWQRCHRMLSVQLAAIAGALQAGWPLLPEDLKAALPPGMLRYISLMLLGALVVGRLIDQGSVTKDGP